MFETLFSPDVLIPLTVASLVGFVGSLIVIPIILVRLPEDFFDDRRPRTWMQDHHPVLQIVGHLVKNVLGVVFLLAGLAMLFLPGQGLLTMLIGISMLDFPGKRRLERRLIGQPSVLGAINKLRDKFRKPPLIVAGDD